MKGLFLTDSHFTGRTPPSRVDNLLEWQIAAFTMIVEDAIRSKVDFVAHSGDFFDTKRVDDNVFEALVPPLRKLKRHKIPFVVVPGNHDGKGGISAVLNSSDLNVLRIFGLVNIVTYSKPFETAEYVIYGYTHDDLATELFLRGEDTADLKERKSDDRKHIALVHYPIGEDARVAKYSASDLNIRSAHVVAVGDIHAGFKICKMTNGLRPKVFNVGAMSQMNWEERENIPRYGVYDFATDKLKRKDLPVEDVFVKTSKAEKRKEVDAEITNRFRQQLAKNSEEPETPEQRVRRIAASRNSSERPVAIVRGNLRNE